MRVASLVSGGKDSIFAGLLASDRGWDVTHYVSVRSKEDHPLLYHRPNIEWVGLQARCAGVQHVVGDAENGDDAEVDALRRVLKGLPVDAVTSGAVASEYQRVRIEQVCEDLGLRSFMPLWHHEPVQHLRDVINAGIRCIFVAVAANGFDQDWLGRPLDQDAIQRLERLQKTKGVHPAGEGGEYETFVLDAPHFAHAIQIEESDASWARDAGTLRIRKARLALKATAPARPLAASARPK